MSDAGLKYLWRVALDCPHVPIARLARQRLVALHVNLAPALQPERVTVRNSFISCAPCISRRLRDPA